MILEHNKEEQIQEEPMMESQEFGLSFNVKEKPWALQILLAGRVATTQHFLKNIH